MYTLTYESVAAKEFSNSEMDELLEKARSNNRKHEITGCLIYYMGGFIQVLEGEKDVIEKLYSKIKVDKRHRKVHMFSDDDIEIRTFPNWGMAYYPIDKDTLLKGEFEQFKRNLLLLANFTEPTNVTARLFWKRIKFIVANPPVGLK